MSNYIIKPYSYHKAKQLNVIIKPSTNPMKKIDVFKNNNNKLCSIGDINHSDYPTYIQTHGKEYANNRRKLYLLRHRNNIGISGFFAREILW